MGLSERDALLTLVLTPGFGQTRVGRCIEALGSAAAVLEASAAQLAGVERIGTKTAATLRRNLDDTLRNGALSRDAESREQWNVNLIALGEPAYPRLLSHIPDPPRLLWVRGELREDDALALGIVGARRCTHYGREQADRFASQCAQAGLCIVSGGAYGIDAAAHRAALRAGGRTLAVLGSGVGKPYPDAHRELFDQIVTSGGGAVISEFPMTVPPIAENFPRRNRIISDLALGVLVVEAARRSGALITARLCVEEHGREAMALPGRLDSAASEGCHRIIQEGWARLVTSASDVLESLGEAGEILKAGASGNRAEPSAVETSGGLFENNLTDPQQKIVSVLHAPRSLDEIAAWTELPVQQVHAELTMLEIRGTVRRERGLFMRRKERS